MGTSHVYYETSQDIKENKNNKKKNTFVRGK
jgi:hypothetical protein